MQARRPEISTSICRSSRRGSLCSMTTGGWVISHRVCGLRTSTGRLRKRIGAGRNLDRWIDFKAHQIFEEVTNYTALQFFTKARNDVIRVAAAPTGVIPQDPWAAAGSALVYGRQVFGERWLLLTGEERALIDRLYQRCKRLDDPEHTSNIFVGLQTSADAIYHLTRIGPDRYLCTPKGDNAQ